MLFTLCVKLIQFIQIKFFFLLFHSIDPTKIQNITIHLDQFVSMYTIFFTILTMYHIFFTRFSFFTKSRNLFLKSLIIFHFNLSF